MARISLDEEKITAFCRKHHIRRLALFGSTLREDISPDSDLDVLVEFELDHVPGFLCHGDRAIRATGSQS